jgi:hypothetical protein
LRFEIPFSATALGVLFTIIEAAAIEQALQNAQQSDGQNEGHTEIHQSFQSDIQSCTHDVRRSTPD